MIHTDGRPTISNSTFVCTRCGKEDGRTRLGGLRCHDCEEYFSQVEAAWREHQKGTQE